MDTPWYLTKQGRLWMEWLNIRYGHSDGLARIAIADAKVA